MCKCKRAPPNRLETIVKAKPALWDFWLVVKWGKRRGDGNKIHCPTVSIGPPCPQAKREATTSDHSSCPGLKNHRVSDKSRQIGQSAIAILLPPASSYKALRQSPRPTGLPSPQSNIIDSTISDNTAFSPTGIPRSHSQFCKRSSSRRKGFFNHVVGNRAAEKAGRIDYERTSAYASTVRSGSGPFGNLGLADRNPASSVTGSPQQPLSLLVSMLPFPSSSQQPVRRATAVLLAGFIVQISPIRCVPRQVAGFLKHESDLALLFGRVLGTD